MTRSTYRKVITFFVIFDLCYTALATYQEEYGFAIMALLNLTLMLFVSNATNNGDTQ
jgi:hypothetical protein